MSAQSRGAVAAPAVDEPAAGPVPPAAAPAQAAHAQAAVRVTVDRTPEEDIAGLSS